LADGPLIAPARQKPGEFQLLTPKSHYFLNSTFANMARHRKAQGLPTAIMNAADAEACAFTSGARVVIKGAAGKVEAHLKVSDTVRAGIILLEGKWWDGGIREAPSMNRLTPSLWSPGGQPAYNEALVTIEPR
jgi:anaerobic selenocysteine-containing dehydrogenase